MSKTCRKRFYIGKKPEILGVFFSRPPEKRSLCPPPPHPHGWCLPAGGHAAAGVGGVVLLKQFHFKQSHLCKASLRTLGLTGKQADGPQAAKMPAVLLGTTFFLAAERGASSGSVTQM